MNASALLGEVLEHATAIEHLASNASIKLLASRILELVKGASSNDSMEATAVALAPRGKSMTPNAVRARKRREQCGQLELSMDGGRDRGRSSPNLAKPGETAVATAVATTVLSPKDPDPKFRNTRIKDPAATAVATVVEHDPDHPPSWVFEDASSLRPELTEYVLRTMWSRFAKRRMRHKSELDARRHFAAWVKRQENRTCSAPAAQGEPPVEATTVPSAPVSERRQRAPERESDDDQQVTGQLFSDDMLRAIAKAQLREIMNLDVFASPPEPRSMSA